MESQLRFISRKTYTSQTSWPIIFSFEVTLAQVQKVHACSEFSARHNLFVEALFQKLPNFWSVLYNRLCLVPRIVQRFIMNLALVVIIKGPDSLKSLSTIKIKIYIAICQVYVPYIYKITLPTSNCHKSFHHYCQPQLILTHSTSLSKHWVAKSQDIQVINVYRSSWDRLALLLSNSNGPNWFNKVYTFCNISK